MRAPKFLDFTDDAIRALKLGTPYRVCDTHTRGLRIEVGAKWKSFVAQWQGPIRAAGYKAKSGRTIRTTLGHFPKMKVKAARIKAVLAVEAIKDGRDPRKGERTYAGGPTLSSALEAWTRDHNRLGRSAHTVTAFNQIVTRVCRQWADRDLADLCSDRGRADVRKLLGDLSEDGKGALANQTATILNAIKAHAGREIVAISLLPSPCHGWTHNPAPDKSARGLRLADLPAWWKTVPSDKRTFALLGLLTGARPEIELRALKWNAIDFDKRTIHFVKPKGWRPDRANDFSLYMTDEIRAALDMARSDKDRVFPPGNYDKPTGVSTWGHDMRRSFASIAIFDCNFTDSDIAPVLNHARSMTARYADRRAPRGEKVLTVIDGAIWKALGLSAAPHSAGAPEPVH
jgi:integrase